MTPRPPKPTKTRVSREHREIAVRCTELHADLIRAGLIVTGHKMHNVVRALGWEMAGDLVRAAAWDQQP